MRAKTTYPISEHCRYMRMVPRGTTVYLFRFLFSEPKRDKPLTKIKNIQYDIMLVESEDGEQHKYMNSDLTCDALLIRDQISEQEVDLPF